MFFCSFSDMQVPLQAFLDGKNGGKSIEIRSKVANVEIGSGICPGKEKSFMSRFFCVERFVKLFRCCRYMTSVVICFSVRTPGLP